MTTSEAQLDQYMKGRITDTDLALGILMQRNTGSVKDILGRLPGSVLTKLVDFVERDRSKRVTNGHQPVPATVEFVRNQLHIPAHSSSGPSWTPSRNYDKGSKKHVLDLVSSSRFRNIMNRVIGCPEIRIAEHCHQRPLSRRSLADSREYELEEYTMALPFPGHAPLDKKWWLCHKTGLNKRPTWDLLCHITVRDRPGLLLVETKAHVREMLEQDKKTAPGAGSKSMQNDRQIKQRIVETNDKLNALGIGSFYLSTKDHYQLANRLSYLAKLASDGVPTVLLYLGWLKSPSWPRDFFRDDAHWHDVVTNHMNEVVPSVFSEKCFSFSTGGSMHMLIRSLDVLQGEG